RGPTGRFNAPDLLSGSAGDAESWNRYTYARNNPLKYVDPDGQLVIVADQLRPAVRHAYANSPTFRQVFNAANSNRNLVAHLSFGSVPSSRWSALTTPVTTAPARHDGELVRSADGELMTTVVSTRAVFKAAGRDFLGALIGHELQHSLELNQYGSIAAVPGAMRTSPPDAKPASYETTTAQGIGTAISAELEEGGTTSLTPSQEAEVFSASDRFKAMSRPAQALCLANPIMCE
ncbi:MAG: hypothetical protein EDX89_24575, partial [Acidobacteria bacterium]